MLKCALRVDITSAVERAIVSVEYGFESAKQKSEKYENEVTCLNHHFFRV